MCQRERERERVLKSEWERVKDRSIEMIIEWEKKIEIQRYRDAESEREAEREREA